LRYGFGDSAGSFSVSREIGRLIRFRREAAMAFIKRAIAPSLALALAAGGLFGIHELVHIARGQNATPAAPTRSFTLKAADGSKKRTGGGPLGTSQVVNPAEDGPAIHLAGDFDRESAGAILPVSGQTAPAPAPMAAPTNAVPLPPVSEDWPLPSPSGKRETAPESGKENSKHASSTGRRIIERELPNSSVEERDLWHEQTKDLSLHDLQELMRIRAQVGRLSVPTLEVDRSTGQPALPLPGSTGMGSGPFYPPANDANGPPAVDPDPGRVIGETMSALVQARQVILNNIANAQTNGYKRRLISFESASDRPMTPASNEEPLHFSFGGSVEAGARLAPVVADMAEGKLVDTNRKLDLAIEGDGLFCVVDAKTKKEAYTRRGRFTTNAAGQMVLRAASGEWVLTPAVTLPKDASEVDIDAEGVVRAWDAEHHALEKVGSLQTASFEAPAALVAGDGTIFFKPAEIAAKLQPPHADGRSVIRQGCLEESNVDVKRELDELAHIANQIQTLEQASHLFQPAGVDQGRGR
jgi:flagellar basal-body rod protein FlgG